MPRSVQVMRTTKKYRSKPYKKRKTSQTAISRYVPRGVVTRVTGDDYGFPDRLVTKLRYCDVMDVGISTGSVTSQTFALNSLYDPDRTNVGHQPMFFDQLSAVYNRYRVLGAKLTVTFLPNALNQDETSSGGPWIVGVTGSSNANFTSNTYSGIVEDSNAKSGMIGDRQGGPNKLTLTQTYSPSRDLGFTADDDTISAVVTANPAQQYYAHCWMTSNLGANNSVKIMVKIEFRAEFFQRKQGVES